MAFTRLELVIKPVMGASIYNEALTSLPYAAPCVT